MDNNYQLNQNMNMQMGRYERGNQLLGTCFDIFSLEDQGIVDLLLNHPEHIVVKSGDNFYCANRQTLGTMFNDETLRYYFYDQEGNPYLELPFNRVYVSFEGAKVLIQDLDFQIFELIDEGIITKLSNWQEGDPGEPTFTPKPIRGVYAYTLDSYIQMLDQ
jgi:hypothetical protein